MMIDIKTFAEYSTLASADIDGNFLILKAAFEEIQSLVVQGIHITDIRLVPDGSALVVEMSNGVKFGPYDLPKGVTPVGAWQSGFQYREKDLVLHRTSAFLVEEDHVSGEFPVDFNEGRLSFYIGGALGDGSVRAPAYDVGGEYEPGSLVHSGGSLFYMLEDGVTFVSVNPIPKICENRVFVGSGPGGTLAVGDRVSIRMLGEKHTIPDNWLLGMLTAMQPPGAGSSVTFEMRIKDDGGAQLLVDTETLSDETVRLEFRRTGSTVTMTGLGLTVFLTVSAITGTPACTDVAVLFQLTNAPDDPVVEL